MSLTITEIQDGLRADAADLPDSLQLLTTKAISTCFVDMSLISF